MKWILKKVDVNQLKEWDKNPRQLTKKGIEDLTKSIKKFGIAEPLVCNSDFTVCGGHGRLKVIKELGIKEVDIYLPEKQLTDKQFEELNIRLNKNIAGNWDFDILANEFEQDELIEWGFEEKELVGLFIEDKTDEELDDAPEPQKEAISKLGDIFLLGGKHRVMCGDSTKEADVSELCANSKADMFLTDPPYNVDYTGKTKEKLKIKNDKIKNLDFRAFLIMAFKNADLNMKGGAVFYIWHADSEGHNFRSACFDIGWQVRQCLIWNKNSMVMGRQDYHWKHEPCLYGWKDGSHLWASDRKQTTVIDFQRPNRNGDHPTMKPVGLIEYQIKNNTKNDDVILDSFLGSGSTLIACEQTNRICYAMELDPIYIDVILKRYNKLYPDKEIKCLTRNVDFDKMFV